jgi:hypothetical protein
MPKGGARPGAGNPGYGKQIAVREGVERLTPRWFAMIEEMLDATPEKAISPELVAIVQQFSMSNPYYAKEVIKYIARGAADDRKFALDQLGKMMGKMMPTEVNANVKHDFDDVPEELYKAIIQRESHRVKVSGD